VGAFIFPPLYIKERGSFFPREGVINFPPPIKGALPREIVEEFIGVGSPF